MVTGTQSRGVNVNQSVFQYEYGEQWSETLMWLLVDPIMDTGLTLTEWVRVS
jgi:hypothetical protein